MDAQYRQERLNEIFAESDAATLKAIHQGRATVAEIRKYEEQTGNRVSPYCYQLAERKKVPVICSGSRPNKARSWSEASNSFDDECENLQVHVAPSKRRKTATERKPRKYVQRSGRDGCFERCISRDSHNQQWNDRELDMKAFEEFAEECLISRGFESHG